MEAIVDAATGKRYNFRELNERTQPAANTLLHLGFNPGDRVACLMSNQPRYAEAYFACAKAGFVFVALNWRLTVPELSYQLLDCGATRRALRRRPAPLVEPLREQFPSVRWLAADAGEFADAVAAASTAEPPIGATGEDPLFMMYTSGTTGRPKGALMSHRGNLSWLASMLATSDLRTDERQIIVAPMFHIAGLGLTMTAVYRGMTVGAGQGIRPRRDVGPRSTPSGSPASSPCRRCSRSCTSTRSARRRAHPDLRWVICGAAPVPVSLIEA